MRLPPPSQHVARIKRSVIRGLTSSLRIPAFRLRPVQPTSVSNGYYSTAMRTGFAPADAEAFGERLGFGEIECGDVERWLRAQRLTNDRGRDAFTVDDNLKRLVDDLSGQPPHSRADGGTDIDFDIGPRICDGLPRILDEKRLFRVRLDAADRVPLLPRRLAYPKGRISERTEAARRPITGSAPNPRIHSANENNPRGGTARCALRSAQAL